MLIFYQSFFNIDGQATLKLCDLPDFASLPEDDPQLGLVRLLITLVTLVISYPTAYVLNRLPNKQFWLLLVILPT